VYQECTASVLAYRSYAYTLSRDSTEKLAAKEITSRHTVSIIPCGGLQDCSTLHILTRAVVDGPCCGCEDYVHEGTRGHGPITQPGGLNHGSWTRYWRAIALAYATEGASLALAARTLDALEQTAHEAQALGVSTCIVPADVSDPTQVEDMVRRTIDRFATIDILVNNAGMAGPVGPLQENAVEAWVQTIQVNLIGTYLCCRAVLPIMRQHDYGKIINLSGAGATNAWRHLSAYSASKVAVVRLTETLALELEGTNIQVNALGPGSIHT